MQIDPIFFTEIGFEYCNCIMVYAVSVFKSYHAFENLANWGILSSKPNYCTGTNTLLIVFLLQLRQNVAITKDQIATKAVLRQKIWVRTSILYN